MPDYIGMNQAEATDEAERLRKLREQQGGPPPSPQVDYWKRNNASRPGAAFSDSNDYDANKFNYGGREGASEEEAELYRNWAGSAQARDSVKTDYGHAYASRGMSLSARNDQNAAAGLMMARARGQVPSISRMAADHQMGMASAAQRSAASGARGAGAIALAQQNAMGGMSAAHSQIAQGAQIAEAQERLAAEQAAFGAYSGIRGGDQALMGQDAQMSQYQAGMDAQQRSLNDQMSLGMIGHARGVRDSQLGAGVSQQQMLANAHAQRQQLLWDRQKYREQKEMEAVKMVAGAAMGGMSGGMMSDVRAKQDVAPLGMTGGATDPTTAQLAQGLAPYSYQYKPGMGPSGPQVGPMAQNMAATPLTANAVTQAPNGMMAIERDGALKGALAGVGHLAQKQAQTDRALGMMGQGGGMRRAG